MVWGPSELNWEGKCRKTGDSNAIVEIGPADLRVTLDVEHREIGFRERFSSGEEGELSF